MSAVQGSSDVVQQQCVTRIFRCTTAAVGLAARIWAAGDTGVHAAQSSPCQRPAPSRRKSRWVPLTKVRHGSGAARGHCSKHMASMPTLTLTLVRGRRGAKLSSSASQPSFPERVGCRGRAPAHGRADRRCQLSARFGTLVAVDTTPMRRPETARQSRSRRRMQGPRTSGLHSQGLPGSASSVVQKVKLARGYGGDDPRS